MLDSMIETLSDSAVRLPAAALCPFVAHYAGIRAHGLPRGAVQHAAPSHYVDLIIGLNRPIDVVRMPSTVQQPGKFTALVGGLQAAPTSVLLEGSLDLLHLFITPLGVRSLLGVPSSALASRVIDLADVWGEPRASELVDRLAITSDWEERFAILDEMFLRALRPAEAPRALAYAWARLARLHGDMPIAALARELGMSRRYFGELFRAELGVAPKTAARIFRFERACRLIMEERLPIADVAAACGFHDQAHMTVEWRALAGRTPRSWIATELPFLQDYEIAGRDDVANEHGDRRC
jgi:AraC-like DNA-binding protein